MRSRCSTSLSAGLIRGEVNECNKVWPANPGLENTHYLTQQHTGNTVKHKQGRGGREVEVDSPNFTVSATASFGDTSKCWRNVSLLILLMIESTITNLYKNKNFAALTSSIIVSNVSLVRDAISSFCDWCLRYVMQLSGLVRCSRIEP